MLEESQEPNVLLYPGGSILHGLWSVMALSECQKMADLKQCELEAICTDHNHSVSTCQTQCTDIQISFVSHLPLTRELVIVLLKTGLWGKLNKQRKSKHLCLSSPTACKCRLSKWRHKMAADHDWVGLQACPATQRPDEIMFLFVTCSKPTIYTLPGVTMEIRNNKMNIEILQVSLLILY